MRLTHYIVASFLSHLLLVGILVVTYSRLEVSPSIFDVDIITLPIQPQVAPTTQKTTEPLPPKKTITPRIGKKSTNLPPQTMYGEGTNHRDTKSPNKANDSASAGSSLNIPSDKKEVSPPESEKSPLKPKSFLFDKETIEEFAKKGTPQEKELTFDTSEFKHRGYLRMLKERIESIWKYPPQAARQGISGDLYIRFSIKRDGRLGEVELVRTSGHKDLDEFAIKAVKDAEPYWPLPQDWDKDDLEITGHFIYLLGGYYIM